MGAERTIPSSNQKGPRYLIKIFLSASFLLVSAGVLLTEKVESYQVSVLSDVSVFLWPGLLLIPAVAAWIVFVDIWHDDSYARYLFLALIVFLVVLFSIPLLKGYTLYGRGGADVLSHLGDVKSILQHGRLPKSNWYPALHVWMTSLSLVGISLTHLPYIVTVFFALFLAIFLFVLARRLSGPASLVGVFCVFALPFGSFHRTVQPAILWTILTILALYALMRSFETHDDGLRHLFVAALLAFFIGLSHPTTAILFVIMSCVALGVRYALGGSGASPVAFAVPAIIPVVSFGSWFPRFQRFEVLVLGTYREVFGAKKPQTVGGQIAQSGSELSIPDLILRTLELYMSQLVLIGVAGLITLFLSYRIVFAGERREWRVQMVVQFYVAGAVSLTLLFVPMFGSALVRVSRYLLLMSLILLPIFLTTLHENKFIIAFSSNKRKACSAVILAFLLVSTGVASSGLYHDHYHLTESEYRGEDWYFSHSDRDQNVRSFAVSYKMSYFLEGPEDINRFRGPFARLWAPRRALPDNLGAHLDQPRTAYTPPSYVITKAMDSEYSAARTGGRPPYSETDVQTFSSSSNVSHLYSNGEFDMWHVT